MGLLVRALEQRFHPSQDPPKWLLASASGWETATGVHVTPENALEVTAVLACVRVLAEGVASLPLVVYERLPVRGKRRAVDHYLYPLLHNQPNSEMTSLEFREILMGHLATWGNGYAEIERNRLGKVVALWPLRPDRMKVRRREGQLQYLYRLPEPVGGNEITLPKFSVLHVRGFGFDGIVGYSPISLARQAIGLAKATEEYGARFFGNDATPGLVLEHPNKLKPEAEKNIRESWEKEYGPLQKKHRMAILEEGMKVEKIGFAPEDSQFLQTRKFSVTEIARIFNVRPHMIADLEKASFSNIEHQGIEHVVYTLRPWLVRWEQCILRDLFMAADRARFFAEFLVEALLRGDTETRFQAYGVARQWGWLSANDVRELENMNPVDGGDAYMIPLNMVPASQAGAGVRSLEGRTVSADPHGERRARQAAVSRRRLATAYARVFTDVARRVIRREIQDVREGARKHFRQRGFAEFSLWLDTFYQEHKDFILRQMAPAFNSYAEVVAAAAADEVGAEPKVTPELEQFIGEYGEAYASRHVGSSIGQVRQVAREAVEAGRDPIEALDERFAEWEERRPEKVAQWETIRANNAVARFVFLAAGIARLRWNAQGENCPYCSRLDGKVIGIQGNFLSAGESFQPSGADVPLVNDHDVGHPPAHEGCLPGYAHVTAGSITAASKRWFDGDLVVVRTAAGQELACTPNHPVLTSSGWAAAGLLDVGGHVVSCRVGDRVALGDVDGQHMPAAIEHVAESFGVRRGMVAKPVPVAPEDFHGDGIGSEVAIVWADGQLRDRVDASGGQQVMQALLVRGNAEAAPMTCPRGHELFIGAFPAAGRGPVGGGRLSASGLLGHSGGADQAGLASVARSNPGLEKSPSDGRATYAELLGKGDLGLAGQVFVDDVVSVERQPFHGYVYNLETREGYYVAEGIVVHNCDCMATAAI